MGSTVGVGVYSSEIIYASMGFDPSDAHLDKGNTGCDLGFHNQKFLFWF